MANEIPQLRTPGVIASELDAPLSRVLYLLRKLNIRPIGRAGVLRLYDRHAVEVIRAEMQLSNRYGTTGRVLAEHSTLEQRKPNDK